MSKSLTFGLKSKPAFVFFLSMLDIDSNFIFKIIEKYNFDAIYLKTTDEFNESGFNHLDSLDNLHGLMKSIKGGGDFDKFRKDFIDEVQKDITEKNLRMIIYVMFIFFKCARMLGDYIHNDEYNFSNYTFSVEKLYNIFVIFDMIMSALIYSLEHLKQKMGSVNLEDYYIKSPKSPSNEIVVFNEEEPKLNQFQLAYLFFHIKVETFGTDKRSLKNLLLKKFKLENEKIENDYKTRVEILEKSNRMIQINETSLSDYQRNIDENNKYIESKSKERQEKPLIYRVKDFIFPSGKQKIPIAKNNIELTEKAIKKTKEDNENLEAIQNIFADHGKILDDLTTEDITTIIQVKKISKLFYKLNKKDYFINNFQNIENQLKPMEHMKDFAEKLDYNPFIVNMMMIMVNFFNFINFYKKNIHDILKRHPYFGKGELLVVFYFINMLISLRGGETLTNTGGRKTIRKYRRNKRSKRKSYKKN